LVGGHEELQEKGDPSCGVVVVVVLLLLHVSWKSKGLPPLSLVDLLHA
jgi:hypothetical protein